MLQDTRYMSLHVSFNFVRSGVLSPSTVFRNDDTGQLIES